MCSTQILTQYHEIQAKKNMITPKLKWSNGRMSHAGQKFNYHRNVSIEYEIDVIK